MRNITTAWEGYRVAVVPEDACEGQVHDTHMAFLAGAFSLQELLESSSDDDGIKILKHLETQRLAAITANKIRSIK